MIKKILIFFVDVLNQRKSLFYINTDSSYQIFRILNRISNGLLTLIDLAAKGGSSAGYAGEAISKLPLDKLD